MSDKVKVKVVEVDGLELKPGAKYIFAIPPYSATEEEFSYIRASLDDLIGADCYVVWPIDPESMKVYEVLPGSSQEVSE